MHRFFGIIGAFIFLSSNCFAEAFFREAKGSKTADQFSTALFTRSYVVKKMHAWPFPPLSIGHIMQSYQNYGGEPYWHDGLDIRANANTPIHAAAGGKVVNIENYRRGNALYWEVAILDEEGFVWKYHHVDPNSISEEIKKAYKTGQKVPDGAFIGNVITWPVTTFGERYHHLHLLIVDKEGKYINPFLFLDPLDDRQAPVINSIGLTQNNNLIRGNQVSGVHGLYLEASDLILHSKFFLPPHKISYFLDEGPEKNVWTFDYLPGGNSDTTYLNDFYLPGTCGDYSCRKFYFNLMFDKTNANRALNLPRGQHQVRVVVSDVFGNQTEKSFAWSVQ